MRTYVTSRLPHARLTHFGDLERTVCGYVPRGSFRITVDRPANRLLCARCLARVIDAAHLEHLVREQQQLIVERDRRRRRSPAVAAYARARTSTDADLMVAMKQGLSNLAMARQLGISERTAVRRRNEARRRAGAKSLFHWGYLVGRAEARPTARGGAALLQSGPVTRAAAAERMKILWSSSAALQGVDRSGQP